MVALGLALKQGSIEASDTLHRQLAIKVATIAAINKTPTTAPMMIPILDELSLTGSTGTGSSGTIGTIVCLGTVMLIGAEYSPTPITLYA